MEHLQEGQSPSDSHSDAICLQSQIVHPENGTPTVFAELCDQPTTPFIGSNISTDVSRCEEETCSSASLALDTGSQDVKQSVDSAKIDEALALSGEAVPVPLVVLSSVNIHAIQQQPESSKFKIESLVYEYDILSDIGNECINSRILCTEQTTVESKPGMILLHSLFEFNFKNCISFIFREEQEDKEELDLISYRYTIRVGHVGQPHVSHHDQLNKYFSILLLDRKYPRDRLHSLMVVT